MKASLIGLFSLGALAAAAPAFAHHSGAMFDNAKSVTVTAVVKVLQWTNPHGWVIAVTPGADGKPEEWGFELSAINIIARKGWSHDVVKPGDKVVITAHPMRDGTKAGLLQTLTLPSGAILKDHNA